MRRAGAGVDRDGVVGRRVKSALRPHEVRKSVVPVAEEVFVVRDVLVDVELAAREGREPTRDAGTALLGVSTVHERRCQQRARVHHRVRGSTGSALEFDRVEGLPRRLDADPVEGVAVGVPQRQGEEERLHGRLDAERHVGVSTASYGAVREGEGERAEVGIGLRELGNAVIHLSPALAEQSFAQGVEVVAGGVECGGHSPSLAGVRSARAVQARNGSRPRGARAKSKARGGSPGLR